MEIEKTKNENENKKSNYQIINSFINSNMLPLRDCLILKSFTSNDKSKKEVKTYLINSIAFLADPNFLVEKGIPFKNNNFEIKIYKGNYLRQNQ